jgi:hypothetical protein
MTKCRLNLVGSVRGKSLQGETWVTLFYRTLNGAQVGDLGAVQ